MAAFPREVHRSGMNFFRLQAAEALAPQLNLTLEQTYEVLEAPKHAEHGDIALPVPKLNRFTKLKGNPAQLATEIATQVRAHCATAKGDRSLGRTTK